MPSWQIVHATRVPAGTVTNFQKTIGKKALNVEGTYGRLSYPGYPGTPRDFLPGSSSTQYLGRIPTREAPGYLVPGYYYY
eukprot:310318-Rhodomonas_salina.1